MPAKLTTDKFIEKAVAKHGDLYNYSVVDYIGSKKKVNIICNIHGVFSQTASDHISGCGCPLCDSTLKMSTINFIEKSIVVHVDKYDYSFVEYGSNNYVPVRIICNIHGEFKQRPWAHLRGQGCPDCSNNKLMSCDEFIKKVSEIHDNKYDYSLVDYKGRRKPISIICKKHGIFEQEARVHLDGYGCKRCKNSKLESYLESLLLSIGEPFTIGKRFNDCRKKYPLPFDFYLPLRNCLVECDGIQHREPVEYFGGEERLLTQIESDKIKSDWAYEHGIDLFRLDNFLDCDNFISGLENSKIVFDKKLIKDLSIDRTKKSNNLSIENYFTPSDFNWYNRGVLNSEIFDFIDSFNINYETDKKIGDSVLDFYMGNVAIYIVDNFSDCEINRDKKWLVRLKDSLENINCNLIVIYPEQWISKCDITKSRIINALGLCKNKIGARKCSIVEVFDNKLVYDFLDNNHIQGRINSSIKLALIYNNEIVSMMTFGKVRRNMGNRGDGWELLRFCNRLEYNINGSASKLYNYFITKYKPISIISYADRCWSNSENNVYKLLGMSYKGKTEPSYSYLVGDKKCDRFKYRKDILVGFGYDGEKWTERSICGSNKIFRIYNAGNLKFEYLL